MALNIERDSFTEKFLRQYESRFTFNDTLLDYDKYKDIIPDVLRFRFDLGENATSIWLGTGKCMLKEPAYYDIIYPDQLAFYTYFLRPGLDGIAAFFYALSYNNYIQLHMVEDSLTDAYFRAEKIKGTDFAVFYADYNDDEVYVKTVIDINSSIGQFRDAMRNYVLRDSFHEAFKQEIQYLYDLDDDIDWAYHEIRGEFLTWRNICQMNWLFADSEKQEIKIENYLTAKQLEEVKKYQKENDIDFFENGHTYNV